MSSRILTNLRAWWSTVGGVIRARRQRVLADSCEPRPGSEPHPLELTEIGTSIAALKEGLNKVRARARTSDDSVNVDRTSVELSELERDYEAAKLRNARELQALAEIAWKVKALEARLEKLMDWRAAIINDEHEGIRRIVSISTKAPGSRERLEEESDRLIEEHRKLADKVMREEERQTPR